MGFFDKALSVAKSVGSQAATTVATAGSELGTAAKDQAAITALKMEMSGIEEEMNAAYVQVGKKYIDYVIASGEMPGVDVSDILKILDPKMTRIEEIKKEIVQLEKKMKDGDLLREKQKAEQDFQEEKAKLDKALAMDLISEDEYNQKINVARKKVDNFEEIRKIEQKYDLGLITIDEKNAEIRRLTK